MQRLSNVSLRGGIEWMCKAQPRKCIDEQWQRKDWIRYGKAVTCDGLATLGRAMETRDAD